MQARKRYCSSCGEFGHVREDCPYGDPQYEEAWNQGLVGALQNASGQWTRPGHLQHPRGKSLNVLHLSGRSPNVHSPRGGSRCIHSPRGGSQCVHSPRGGSRSVHNPRGGRPNVHSPDPADTASEPPCLAPAQELHSTVSQLRESLALLEVELVELWELVLTRLSDNDSTAQQLRDELTQVKNEYKALFRELRAEVKELQQDRETLKRELAGVREEMQQRERRHTAPSSSNFMESTLNQTAAKPCRETAPHTPTTPARHADTPTHNADITHSDNTQSDTRPELETEPEAAPTPPSRQQHHAEVALLIDSNGKFISEQRLFPGRKVSKIWCPTTGKALQELSKSSQLRSAAQPRTSEVDPLDPQESETTTGTTPATPAQPSPTEPGLAWPTTPHSQPSPADPRPVQHTTPHSQPSPIDPGPTQHPTPHSQPSSKSTSRPSTATPRFSAGKQGLPAQNWGRYATSSTSSALGS
ncbi:UNVERIFIED_CONTAM: hypothetical protein FKN15_073598 [Acipenser sinensis]